MGLRLFFLSNFPGAMFIQGGTFIPDSRVWQINGWGKKIPSCSYSALPCTYIHTLGLGGL